MPEQKKRKVEDRNEISQPLNFIDNAHVPLLENQETLAVKNPANGLILCHVPLSTSAQVDQAVASASKAFQGWRYANSHNRKLSDSQGSCTILNSISSISDKE
jgi:hypothetical protein